MLGLTVINFAWTFTPLPRTYYFQVIGAIGLSMMVLSALLYLPRPARLAFALLVIFGHDLLDPIPFGAGQPGQALWALLHDGGWQPVTSRPSSSNRIRITEALASTRLSSTTENVR
ncbi:hypothetical protein [Myxococcus sp. SDU36]|uniref:hypothetical protein n=1 Tax=Myxococcus sp. SDU36 TaxID=2831967 RepID=UPI0025427562|nr:hypothetical protein [Myxococcus sp. SDU36]